MSKSFGANVIKMSTSRIATWIISFVSAPIIARLFVPSDFGIRQIFMSIAGATSVLVCLRYELSIPLGKDEEEASASFTLSVLISLIFTLLVLAVVAMGRGKVAQWFKAPQLSFFLWLLPISVFMRGLESPLQCWAQREGSFGAMAWANFGNSLVGKLVTRAWGLIIGASAAGLFAGYFAAATIGTLLLVVFLSRKLISELKKANITFEVLCTVAKRYRKFPIFETWSRLLNLISTELPPVILGLYFSTTVVGYYSLGKGVISLPLALLGSSIGQVFFPTAAKEYNETGTISEIVSNIFRRLIQIGVFPMIALSFLGPILFRFIFGQQWIESGVYMQILSGWMLFFFIVAPLGPVWLVLQRQGSGLAFNAALTLSGALALLLGGRMGSPRIALVMYAIVSVLGYNLLLCWILRISHVSLRWGAKLLLKYVASSCVLLLPAGYFAWTSGKISVVFVSLGFAAVIYVWGLYRFDTGFRNTVINILKKF